LALIQIEFVLDDMSHPLAENPVRVRIDGVDLLGLPNDPTSAARTEWNGPWRSVVVSRLACAGWTSLKFAVMRGRAIVEDWAFGPYLLLQPDGDELRVVSLLTGAVCVAPYDEFLTAWREFYTEAYAAYLAVFPDMLNPDFSDRWSELPSYLRHEINLMWDLDSDLDELEHNWTHNQLDIGWSKRFALYPDHFSGRT
jgi:hypothetical protein